MKRFALDFLRRGCVACGIGPIVLCVVYLIMSAGIKLWKQMKKTVFQQVILWGTVGCMVIFSLLSLRFSTIFYILISGIAGIVLYLLKKEAQR